MCWVKTAKGGPLHRLRVSPSLALYGDLSLPLLAREALAQQPEVKIKQKTGRRKRAGT